MRLRPSSFLRGVLLLALAPIASATTWYVNGVSGSDSHNCLSPSTACKTIGHAISLASSGDAIKVAAATYYENLSVGRSLSLIGSGAMTTIIDGGSERTGQCSRSVITISNTAASVTLSDVTVRNGCAQYGGGISNQGTLRIIASTISGNLAHISVATGKSVAGGGIYNYGTMTISSSTVAGNAAVLLHCFACYAYGGGVSNGGTLIINNSTLNGNSAGSLDTVCKIGFVFGPCPTFGGGISNGGTLIISNSTLSGNAASPNHGGGINGPAQIRNSIIAHSPSGGNCSGSITSEGYNLSSDGTCKLNGPGDMNHINPLLGALTNNGGPTQTMALLPGSPAIDGGNPSGCTDSQGHLLKTDQRGLPRPDTEDKTGCDMGAYERQSD